MSRLLSELRRLYGLDAGPASATTPTLIDAEGRTRTLVIELARPADWGALARLWEGLQADLDWPAPSIAINGRDGFQLWVSLAEPVTAAQAGALLAALVARYLADVPAQRVAQWPGRAESGVAWRHVDMVPREHPGGQWSAFVSPGLAPVFADTPWLDIPPGEDGQADLLSGLKSVGGEQLREAVASLGGERREDAAAQAVQPAGSPDRAPAASGPQSEPHRFLLQVMNDERVDMALRIEAAKALLPYAANGV